MSTFTTAADDAVALRKSRVNAIRAKARALFDAGTPGIHIASSIGNATDQLVCDFVAEALASHNPGERRHIADSAAVVAVGGTGRGDLAPYSDVDLLFLDGGAASSNFRSAVNLVVQSCWDAKLKLGHAVRTVGECVAMARQDPQIATAVLEARLLWGSQPLFEKLRQRFQRRVVRSRLRAYVDACIEARSHDWTDGRPAMQELEPNIKSSLGGLRDAHLVRWIGGGVFSVRDTDSLRLAGALTRDEARQLKAGYEFLTRVRIDLHLAAGQPTEILTRDEQLRIAEDRGVAESAGQRSVERFMQEYFQHSSNIAQITQRFVARHRPRSIVAVSRSFIVAHRADRYLRVTGNFVDVGERDLPRVCRSLESILRLYKSAALYGVVPTQRVAEAITAAVKDLQQTPSAEAAELFMDILGCTRHLGPVLRSMYATRLLDVLIPAFTHARCLLQFNQYHHYTVDEHTLRTIEAVTSYDDDDGPIGAAYRSIRHKELLHLALLLHDLGKGFEEDHSDVGKVLAEETARRLSLTKHQTHQLAFLVHKHLEMSLLAFRRDISDPKLLVEFGHQVGSPETLRMLYVLTAADITAVGPGVWTDWKGELLADLYDRVLLILSGKHFSYHEKERMRQIKRHVARSVVPTDDDLDAESWQRWVDKQLAGFSAYYLTCTAPELIAADLDVIQNLDPDEFSVTVLNEEETGTCEYCVITKNPALVPGCFHKIVGVLTAKRLEILSADINTASGGVIVDRFRVIDHDYEGSVPQLRFDEVRDAMKEVICGTTSVESLFQRYKRFGAENQPEPVSDLPTRVALDAESSDSRTIVDVFAHDRPGLLYAIARTLFELNLSVDLAKIATHFDQVVDVFYITELDGQKVTDGSRLQEIRETLEQRLLEFEQQEHRVFVQ
ncbi:Bifunctional uridylyltransferase/uridylyl-removing enzyme [Maioricimonas rarisocia]|uniref:Bifunctional uridylyltransferase/uridylyl-removing enzyme n=1 Tax=Maioricimonas rarisocia TaxID=2528026 RepID=A0A517ZFN7_9PLAN|nr:[protein-PII] uridylyltransferase [Maioricimonas rarisocia]QDU41300.1 Bifunctional uridylyltransferase/uridylyl-removing enzyme [Maioricimonas rarisocia]